jgi:hypothetical protein
VVLLGSAGLSLNDQGPAMLAHPSPVPKSRAIDVASDPASREEISISERAAALADQSTFGSGMR